MDIETIIKTAGPYDELDSLAKMELLCEVEELLDVNIPLGQLEDWSNYDDVRQYVTTLAAVS
jgi:acyl carrier protein